VSQRGKKIKRLEAMAEEELADGTVKLPLVALGFGCCH
jgi:hypothetical protein